MLFLGFAQSLISTFFFLLRRPRHLSSLILSAWFFIITLFFLGVLLPKGLTTYTKIGFVPFLALSGPIFYFYVRSLIESSFSFTKIHLLHLLPFTLLSILRVIFLPESISPEFYGEATYRITFLSITIVIGGTILLYWFATLQLILRHQKNILDFFSNKSKGKSLKWVLPFMFCVLLSNLLFFLTPRFQNYGLSTEQAVFWFQHFNLAIMGYLLLYFGLTQPIIFEPLQLKQNEEKYAKSGLDQHALEANAQKIEQHFKEAKPFINPEYNLQLLANELSISRQNLSQSINEVFNKNFYQLVNEYRVEEFKRLSAMPQYEHLTLFGVALEAGFNSKSSFNRIFKEITGLTPSQFIKQNRS